MRIAGIATMTAVFVLAACGSVPDSSYEDTSPEDIAKDIAAAMNETTSLHIASTSADDNWDIDVDLAIAESGDCEGKVSLGPQGSFKLVVAGGDSFVKPNERFWRTQGGSQADTLIGRVGDKWVSGELAQRFEAACDWETTMNAYDNFDDKITEVTGTDEVDGEATVTVSVENEEGNPGVAQVLASDPHYLVKLEVEDQVDATLSEFNEPVEPETPADATDVDAWLGSVDS